MEHGSEGSVAVVLGWLLVLVADGYTSLRQLRVLRVTSEMLRLKLHRTDLGLAAAVVQTAGLGVGPPAALEADLRDSLDESRRW